ncbi:hypothetical protein TNCV_2381491 [Trichonephila clavipes]|nr:hypothetical protein TNCV_2381491 [Trichonephila clavipes]
MLLPGMKSNQTRAEKMRLMAERISAYIQPPGQPIGVTIHYTQHPIREQPLSAQSSQKTLKIFHPEQAP